MSQSDLSVVVVSYNTRDKLDRCLTCLPPDVEVIVVDNNSTDGSQNLIRERFPWVKLIENTSNVGFGAANNIGADAASNSLVLFLNSDAYAKEGSVNLLADIFEDPEIVAAGGKLLNLDGSLQQSTANRLTLWAVFCEQLYLDKAYPKSSVFSPYWTTTRLVQASAPVDTEQVMGACLMVRKGLERFDERYFLYCEDTDLCLRLRSHGRIVFFKNAEFLHELGSSSAGSPLKGVKRYNQAKVLYFRIHHGIVAALTCAFLNRVGAALRSVYWFGRFKLKGAPQGRELGAGFLRLALYGAGLPTDGE